MGFAKRLTVCISCDGWAWILLGSMTRSTPDCPEGVLPAVPAGGSPQRPVHIILVIVQDAVFGGIFVWQSSLASSFTRVTLMGN